MRGGDATEVLAHLLSTNGWTSWPDAPHHPKDPDDTVFTSNAVPEDIHFLYLFDVASRRIDILCAESATLEHSIRFGEDGRPSRSLGEVDANVANLQPVMSSWLRHCPEPVARPLAMVLDELHLGGNVGINVSPSQELTRELCVGARSLHVEASGRSWDSVFWSDGEARPFPDDICTWLRSREAYWNELCHALGLEVDVLDGSVVHFRRVVSECVSPNMEISIEEARAKGYDVELGDELGEEKRPHLIWNWLFDRVWCASS